MIILISRSRLAPPNSYHPDLEESVAAARAADVHTVIFPALLRLDLIKATPEQFFRDIARARHKDCESCMAANVKCVLHNGSSYRCLRCWVKQLRGCSHEAYMVEQGYRNPPICRQYSDAAKENLTPVPDSLVWGAMSVQGSDIADLPKGVDEEDDDGESVTIMLSDDGREGEEEEDNEDESNEDEEENQEDEEDEDGGSPSKRKTKRPNVERLLEGIAKDLKTIIGLLKDKSGTAKEAVIVKDEDALPQSLDAYELGPHWQRRAREEQQGPIAGPSRASGGE